MTRDDIIRMAREAGIYRPYWDDDEDPNKDPPRWVTVGPIPPLLERFAALVAAAVVPKTALAEGYRSGYEAGIKEITRDVETMLVGMLNDAISQEREACAKVCEERARKAPMGSDEQCEAEDCAAAIRARGEE